MAKAKSPAKTKKESAPTADVDQESGLVPERFTAILGEQTPTLESRMGFPGGRSEALRKILERYEECIRQSIPPLSIAEWHLICDSMNGCLLMPARQVAWLAHGISDSISLDRLDEKWQVDGAALLDRLRGLSYAGCLAVADVAERFWTAVSNREDGQDYSEKIVEEAHRIGNRLPPKKTE